MNLIINENLYLEQVQLSDATDIFNTIDHQREYLGDWLPFVQYIKEVADEENFLKSVLETMEQTQEYIFCIRKDEKFVGLISFIKPDIANQKTEIGYWISKDYQKQGVVIQTTKRRGNFCTNDFRQKK